MSQLARTTQGAAPMTPRTPSSAPATPSVLTEEESTPGRWKHPQFDEIARRQYATTFDERNVRKIVVNATVLIITVLVFNVTAKVVLLRALQGYLLGLQKTWPYTKYMLHAFRFLLVTNIFQAAMPLVRRYYPDDIADIPLTPSQRQAMGLDPNVTTPQTPGSAYASPNYITPPRYQKSTPRSSFGTPGERQSPLSGSPRASMAKSTSNSPFSPSTGSPLFQKAVGGSATKRLSFDTRGSPLSGSSLFLESSSSNTPGTPTPGAGKASVGLNNKWLYDKGRASPRSSLFS